MNKLTLFSIGIGVVLGVISGITNNPSTETLDDNTYFAKEVFERYEQIPLKCPDKTRITHHGLFALKGFATRSELDKTAYLIIEDSNNLIEVTMTDTSYGYKNLFSKDVHFESRREYCSPFGCTSSINYYIDEYPNSNKIPRKKIELTYLDRNKDIIRKNKFPISEVPNKDLAKKQEYTPIKLNKIGDKLIAKVDLTNFENGFAMFQTRFNGNMIEEPIELEGGKLHTLNYTMQNSKPTYAAIFVFADKDKKGFENKVEIINSDKSNFPQCE